jgi:hypothetical protein
MNLKQIGLIISSILILMMIGFGFESDSTGTLPGACQWDSFTPDQRAFAAQPGGTFPLSHEFPEGSYLVHVGPTGKWGTDTPPATWNTYGPYYLRAGHKYRALIESGGLRWDEDTGDLNAYDVPSIGFANVYARNNVLGDIFYAICLTPVAGKSASTSPIGTWDWSWGTSKHVTLDIKTDGTWEQYDDSGSWNRGQWEQQGNSIVLSAETCGRGCEGEASVDTVILSEDGQKMTGTNNNGNPLTGLKKSMSSDWTGIWDTTWGEMELQRAGDTVTGSYGHNDGTLKGTISDNKLKGTWRESLGSSTSGKPEHDYGPFEFTMSADGNTFDGTWYYSDGTTGGYSEQWTGERVT